MLFEREIDLWDQGLSTCLRLKKRLNCDEKHEIIVEEVDSCGQQSKTLPGCQDQNAQSNKHFAQDGTSQRNCTAFEYSLVLKYDSNIIILIKYNYISVS